MSILENIERLRERVQSACQRAARKTEDVRLMAVTKTVAGERIREAYAAGIRIFGENRVQELSSKVDALDALAGAEWHLIGHLQTNKVNRAAELFTSVDSVDSFRLAEKLHARASELRKPLPILLEINIGGEAQKSGLRPGSNELEVLLSRAPEFAWLAFSGLMTVPPYTADPSQARPYFQAMRELFHAIAQRKLPAIQMEVLSMGMSHDFEVAIEEGANLIRIGTAIFGERPARTD